jgi:membrane-associated HD superfamily phosphohydrolase|tara:strand:+ start:1067 stop:1669 length:603 start_codon:yes stop_codon:yes gene_type:complete
MKSTEMLNQIKTLLNIEVKLEEQKLENGTIISAESFEKGNEIFIKTDDQSVAMPVGEYLLEDGRLLIVEEEGIIADVREVSDEVPAKEEEEVSEEVTEDLAEEDDIMKDMMGRIQNLEDAIADLKADKEGKLEKDEEVEMEQESVSKQPKSRTVKEEFNAASAPIKHNPESSNQQKSDGYMYSQKRVGTTLDRVLSRLNK